MRWRTHGEHHCVQEKGRFEIFEDYHLRVGEVTDDSDPPRGIGVGQQRFDETANPVAKAVSITELAPPDGNKPKIAAEHLPASLGLDGHADGLVDGEVFESIYNPGKPLLLVTCAMPRRRGGGHRRQAPTFGKLRHRRIRIIRDYGMTDRDEAPQFYPAVGRAHDVAAE